MQGGPGGVMGGSAPQPPSSRWPRGTWLCPPSGRAHEQRVGGSHLAPPPAPSTPPAPSLGLPDPLPSTPTVLPGTPPRPLPPRPGEGSASLGAAACRGMSDPGNV